MQRKRTIGNRVWIGLLGFCLLVFAVLLGVVIYLMRFEPWWHLLAPLAWLLIMTLRTYEALQRRISISGG
jgi:membrane protein YdbS with pleckstrin-like domain